MKIKLLVIFIITILCCQGKGNKVKNLPNNRFNYAYWLNPEKEYVFLALLKIPIELFPTENNTTANDLIMSNGIILITYGKDSICNTDMKPFKQITSIKMVNLEQKKVKINRDSYSYEDAEIADIIKLLENPEGKIPIHRIYRPLEGMEDFSVKLLENLKL